MPTNVPSHDQRFIERLIVVLASGVALNLPDQVRVATTALAKEFNVPLPAEFPRE